MIKKGFTLSEVMVTLGVLGVLAAILVPAITKNSPDSRKVMFKKSYYTLEKAVSELISDDVNYPSNARANLTDQPTVSVQRGFNYQDVTGSVPTAPAVNKFCYLLSQEMNTVGTVKCKLTDSPNYTFMTSDGVSWSPRYNSDATNFPLKLSGTDADLARVLIDINGTTGPNCGDSSNTYVTTKGCSAGTTPDQYEIAIRFDGKLYVDVSGTAILENPMKYSK